MADMDFRVSGEEGTIEFAPLDIPFEAVDVRADGKVENAEVGQTEHKASVDSPVFDMSIEHQPIVLNVSPEMREMLLDLAEIVVRADTERINNLAIEEFEHLMVMDGVKQILVDQSPHKIIVDQDAHNIEAFK